MRVVIVQARMGSTRLPGKVMLPLNGHTVLAEVLERCGRIRADLVCLTIPSSVENDILDREGSKAGVTVSRGPEHDVLKRYVIAAQQCGADRIMRITADCPLICPELCSDVFDALGDNDYASNLEPRTFPQGLDCEAFTLDALLRSDCESSEREHVTTYLRTGPFRRTNVTSPWKIEGRLTLDTWDDYQIIKACFPERRLSAA